MIKKKLHRAMVVWLPGMVCFLVVAALAVSLVSADTVIPPPTNPPGTNVPPPTNPPGTNVPPPTNPPGTNVPPSGTTQLESPLNNIPNLCVLVDAILKIVTEIGAIIAVFLIVWSGFLFVRAQGNQAELANAKATFYTTIIGLAILLGASVAARIILLTISNIISPTSSGICS